MWDRTSLSLETVPVLVQEKCTVCAKRTIGSEIILVHPLVLLGDETQVEARLGPFEDSANLDTRLEHGLRRTYHRLRNCLGHTRWNN